MADVAHIMVPRWDMASSPFIHCDIVTTTHKTLRGPLCRSYFFIKLTRETWGREFRRLPSNQGGPHNNTQLPPQAKVVSYLEGVFQTSRASNSRAPQGNLWLVSYKTVGWNWQPPTPWDFRPLWPPEKMYLWISRSIRTQLLGCVLLLTPGGVRPGAPAHISLLQRARFRKNCGIPEPVNYHSTSKKRIWKDG
jgi:hypothetical protein